MSNNEIVRIATPHLARLAALNALILSHNAIAVLEKDSFSALRNLNTLVLSHNKVSLIPDGMLAGLPNLKKVSFAHNQLKAFPVGLPSSLQELRLNDNKIPTPSTKPELPFSLTLLDIGNNLLRSLEPSLGTALSALPKLINLNLKGNPVCNEPGYREAVLMACSEAGSGTGLRILDGNRFDEKFLKRKEKMVAYKRNKEFREKKKAAKERKASAAAESGSGSGSGSDAERERERPKKRPREVEQDGNGPKKPRTEGSMKPKVESKLSERKPKMLMLARPETVDSEKEDEEMVLAAPSKSEKPSEGAGVAKKTRRGKRGGKGATATAEAVSASEGTESAAKPAAPKQAEKAEKAAQKNSGNKATLPKKGAKPVAREAKPKATEATADKGKSVQQKPYQAKPKPKMAPAKPAKDAKPAPAKPAAKPATAQAAPSTQPAKEPKKSEEDLLAARSGVVAVIDNTVKSKKKGAAPISDFDPSALASADPFESAVHGWD